MFNHFTFLCLNLSLLFYIVANYHFICHHHMHHYVHYYHYFIFVFLLYYVYHDYMHLSVIIIYPLHSVIIIYPLHSVVIIIYPLTLRHHHLSFAPLPSSFIISRLHGSTVISTITIIIVSVLLLSVSQLPSPSWKMASC